jgi:CheY-like chemotaxis protein
LPVSSATPVRPGSSPGILVVDDEVFLRTLLDRVLRQHGCTVWLAADGLEALALYREQQHHIDLVLLDVRMPGLDGPQTLTLLRQLNPEVRCCFMSGDFGKYAEEALLGQGAWRLLRKPFHLAEVAQVVQQLVSSSAGQT